MTVTRRKLGEVWVDSGQIMVVDPCYASKVVSMYTPGELPATGKVQPVAVTFRTEKGDGVFPVFAEKDEEGKLVRIVIEMGSDRA